MRLKIATTVAFVFGLSLLAAWPWLVGAPPDGGTRDEVRRYAIRLLTYFAATCFVFLTTAVLAWRTSRVALREIQDESRENMRELIEGALKDHERHDG